MNDNIWILYLILSFIGFIVGVFITRWIFRIDTMVEYQKKQYMILREMARRNGVNENLIEEIDSLK